MSYEAPTIHKTEQVRPNTTLEAQLPTLSQENLLDAIANIRNPELLANVVGNPFVQCNLWQNKCWYAVERVNTFWGKAQANKYCQERYGDYPHAFAKRIRVAGVVPTPAYFCFSDGFNPKNVANQPNNNLAYDNARLSQIPTRN